MKEGYKVACGRTDLEPWEKRLLVKFGGDLTLAADWEEQMRMWFERELPDLDRDSVCFLAKQSVLEAQAWQFLQEHPVAPRQWRSLKNGWTG